MSLFGGVLTITGVSYLMLTLFAILALGYALGRITIKGISLGSAGVFIIALVYGAFFYTHLDAAMAEGAKTALKIVENIGLILFVSSVGFIAGPKFFSNMKRNFKSYVLIGLVIILSGGIAAALCILFGRTVGGETDYEGFTAIVSGLLSGALTSTPAFSAAKATVGEAYEDLVSVGYGIAYLFGVIGVVLFVQLVPKLEKADMKVEREKMLAAGSSDEKKTKSRIGTLKMDPFGIMMFSLAAAIGLIACVAAVGFIALIAVVGHRVHILVRRHIHIAVQRFLHDLGILFLQCGQLVSDVADLLRLALKQLQLICRKLILGGVDGFQQEVAVVFTVLHHDLTLVRCHKDLFPKCCVLCQNSSLLRCQLLVHGGCLLGVLRLVVHAVHVIAALCAAGGQRKHQHDCQQQCH